MGFTWQRGIGERPKLLKKEVVNEVILEEAAKGRQEGTAPTTKYTPDIRSRGGPLWRHGPDVNHKGYEEQVADGHESGGGEAGQAERQTQMPKTRLERRRILNTANWTAEGKKGIEACKGARAKTRERSRLLRNWSAAEKGQHVLALSSGAMMKCTQCGREAAWRRILQWPKTRCSEAEAG